MKKTSLFLLLCSLGSVALFNFAYAIDCSTIDARIEANTKARENWSVTQTNMANECMFCHSDEEVSSHANNLKDLINERIELSKEKSQCEIQQKEQYEQQAKQEEQEKIKKEQEEKEAKEIQTKKEKEVEEAKKALWNKAAIFESLVPLFKAKDEKTQTNVKKLLKTFSESKDAYTRNIWIYFWYLVE